MDERLVVALSHHGDARAPQPLVVVNDVDLMAVLDTVASATDVMN
jgi:hypothetical protein